MDLVHRQEIQPSSKVSAALCFDRMSGLLIRAENASEIQIAGNHSISARRSSVLYAIYFLISQLHLFFTLQNCDKSKRTYRSSGFSLVVAGACINFNIALSDVPSLETSLKPYTGGPLLIMPTCS